MRSAIGLIGLLFAGFAQAATVVVDFESLYWSGEGSNQANVTHGNTYVEDGYQITDVDGEYELSTWAADVNSFTGSTAMFNNTRNATTELTQVGGENFSLISIDLARLHISANTIPEYDPLDFVTITFMTDTGHSQTFDVGHVEGEWLYDDFWEIYYIDAAPEASTFYFDSGFLDVAGVTWVQNHPGPHQFDNIVVANVVPIPAAAWLFGSALAGLGWMRNRGRTRIT